MESKPNLDDVILDVGGERFECKRKLLSEISVYFQAMFSDNFRERDQSIVKLQGVDPKAMDTIIQSIKNDSQIDFRNCEDIIAVLEASCMLHFDTLRDNCVRFILDQWLSIETCLHISIISDKLGLIDLQQKAKMLSLWHFSQVKKTESFLELSGHELEEYLSDDRLRTLNGEFEVFEAGEIWIDHQPDERLFYSLALINLVRFRDVPVFDITSMFHYTSVKDTPQAELILECLIEIKENRLNEGCAACNQVDKPDDARPSTPTTPSRLFSFSPSVNASLKRKRRITASCTCFDNTTINSARAILLKESRHLPLVPCVIGTVPLDKTTFNGLKPVFDRHRQFHSKCKLIRLKVPFVCYWVENHPEPFLYLHKIDNGPSEAMGYKVVTRDLELYVIGGEYLMGKGDWNTSVWAYSLLREAWQFVTSLPSPTRSFSVLFVEDDLYIIGGVGKHRVQLSSVNKYNVVLKCWEPCTPLPRTMYSAACCVFRGNIYMFDSQAFCYRPWAGNWELMSEVTLPDNVVAAAAMSYQEWIYLIGRAVPVLYRFQPHRQHCAVEEMGKFTKITQCACLVNDAIFLFGEEDHCQSVEKYSIAENEFTVLWEGKGGSDVNFSQAVGCFPFPKYFDWNKPDDPPL